jgi:uncharacterized membrane protein YiaA
MSNISTAEKINTLKHTMDRYDHYYDSVNNKANLFLTLNTFLFGGIITGYYSIKDQLVCGFDFYFFVVAGLILCILSIGFSLWATMPYLSKQADSLNGSVIYFGNVANVSYQSFKQMYNDMTDEKRYEDYLQQVFLLAIGLQNKFYRLKVATYLLGGCFVCIIIIGYKLLNIVK